MSTHPLCFSAVLRLPPLSTLFPYTTLFRSTIARAAHSQTASLADLSGRITKLEDAPAPAPEPVAGAGDRKSTRLNSSHVKISYAVFCLKKKNQAMPRERQHSDVVLIEVRDL